MIPVELDFQIAKAKHLQFKSRLRAILYDEDSENEVPVASEFECPVGKWIYGHALAKYGSISELHELERVHADIHRSARELIRLYKEGNVQEARRGLTQVDAIAEQLISLFDVLQTKISNPDVLIEAPTLSEYQHIIQILSELLEKNKELDERIKTQTGDLASSQKTLSTYFREAPGFFCIVKGRTHRFELVNNAYAKLVGNRDVTGKTVQEILPEVEAQGFIDLLNNVYDTQQPFIGKELKIGLVNNDDTVEERYLDFVYQPLVNGTGETEGIIVFGYDVTEKVAARKSVEDIEQNLRSVINSAPFPIGVYTGREMRITLANQNILDVWGKGNDVIGKLYAEILPELATSNIFKELDDVYTTGIAYHAKNNRVDILIDGALKSSYFNYSFTPLHDAVGNIYGVMNTAADVTDLNIAKQKLEESEARFRLMTNIMPQMIWTGEPTGELTYYSQHVYDYSGYDFETIKNVGWLHIVHPDDRDENVSRWMRSVTTGEDFTFEHRFRRYDGEYRWQLSRATPQKNEHGVIQRWIGTSTDIHEQKIFTQELERQVKERTQSLQQANDTLGRSNKELESTNAELASFNYIASHDLQEPLRKIRVFTERIKEKEEGKLQQMSIDYLGRIDAAAIRMQTLINSLIQYSRTTAADALFEVTNLNSTIEDIKLQLQESLERKYAIVSVADLPKLKAIPFQVQQLFTNLFENAIKYSQPNIPLRVNVTTQHISGKDLDLPEADSQQNYIKIMVQDNGIGFEQALEPKIFELFQRLHSQNEYSGSGIGLVICKKIMRNHNGFINAVGKVNEGSTFNLYFPVIQTI